MRQRRSFVGMLFAVVSFAVHAQSPTVSNVTALDSPPDKRQEPVVIVHPYGGGERALVAYMKMPQPPQPADPLIYTSWAVPGEVMTWNPPQPVRLYNPDPYVRDIVFDKSGDPVLVGNGAGATYLTGTTYNGTKCTGTNQISIWTPVNGGESWSYPMVVHRNWAGSSLFADKPAALVSKFSRTAGMVYVAFTNFGIVDRGGCFETQSNTLHFYRFDPGSGNSTPLSTPASGNITNAQIFEDQWTGMLYLAYQDYATHRVVLLRSGDLGSSWIQCAYIPTNFPPEMRGISMKLGLTGRFTNYTLALAWHRLPATGAGVEGVVVFYTPSNGQLSGPFVVSEPNRYSFYPTVELDGSGRFFITYYDYDHAASPLKLLTTLRSSIFIWNGTFWTKQCGSERKLDETSGPYTAPSDSVGEYQGLYYRLGYFYAVTMFRSGSRDDVHHVRFTPY